MLVHWYSGPCGRFGLGCFPEREHAEVIGPGEDDQLLCGLLAPPFRRADDAPGAAGGDLHSAGVGNAPMSTYGATRGVTAAAAGTAIAPAMSTATAATAAER